MTDGSVGMGQAVDWPEVLIDLRRRGHGVGAVARALNLPRTTVHSWLVEGVEPRYTNGIALVRLYLAVVEKTEPPSRFAVPLTMRR